MSTYKELVDAIEAEMTDEELAQVKAINLTSHKIVPNRPTNTEVDELMEQVSEQLGTKWLAAHDRGWLFKPAGEPGGGVYSRKRAFLDALSEVFERTIVVMIK